MSDNGRSVENENRNQSPETGREGVVPMPIHRRSQRTKRRVSLCRFAERRAFPVRLPISVKSNTGERLTESENISANGVLFQLDSEMRLVQLWTSQFLCRRTSWAQVPMFNCNAGDAWPAVSPKEAASAGRGDRRVPVQAR